MAYKIAEMANPARLTDEFPMNPSEPFIFEGLAELARVSASYLV
jgi:hypothetical protein